MKDENDHVIFYGYLASAKARDHRKKQQSEPSEDIWKQKKKDLVSSHNVSKKLMEP